MAGYPRSDIEADNWQTVAPENWSWLDHVKAYGSDAGNALLNLGSNLVEGVSPFAPTATQYGKPSLQVPPMAQGLADSFSRLIGTPSQPGYAWDLTGVKEHDAPILADGANALLSFTGGQAVGGLRRGAANAATPKKFPYQIIKEATDSGGAYRVYDNERLVGDFIYDELPNANMVRNAFVDPDYRRQGIAGNVYGKMQDDLQKPMTPDAQLTPDGYAFWKDNYPKAVKGYKFDGANYVPNGDYVNVPDLLNQFAQEGVPSWRMSGGPNRPDSVLWSDTGKPSLFGSALATVGEQPKGVSVSGQHPNYSILNDGSPVGRAYVREYPKTIQLGQLHVDPEFQRQGIATEAQRLLAQQYGKPTVPDVNLSQSELARWQKNDPAAVADYEPYFPGASSFSPRWGTDGYYASQGSGMAPGSRAASGELFSDNKPSLFGTALATAGEQLPMDTASRMQRAREMGFDTDTTWYHGSKNDIEAFDPSRAGSRYMQDGEGTFFASDPAVASRYALSNVGSEGMLPSGLTRYETAFNEAAQLGLPAKEVYQYANEVGQTGANVVPAYVRSKNPLNISATADNPAAFWDDNFKSVMDTAKAGGHDSIVVTTPDGQSMKVVLDPKNIRSVNAAFDPAKADSANLLAAKTFGLPQPQDQNDIDLAEYLRRYGAY